MRFSFESFFPLLLLIPALGVIIVSYTKFAKKNTRQRLFLFLRLFSVVLIILSMCSISIVKTAKDTATLLICDLSDSTLDRRVAIENFVKDAIKAKGNDDIVGVVAFGNDSSTENKPSKSVVFSGFQSYVNTDFTNIQTALIHGSALFPANAKKRIVLITDGLENAGDSERQLRSLVQNNTIVDVYPITRSDFNEVQLNEVIVPEKANINQVIDIAVQIESNTQTDATLQLYAGNAIKLEKRVKLDVGTNKFIFTDTVNTEGILTYRVEILPDLDTYMENNYLSSYCAVGDKPTLLIVQDEDEQGKQFIEMLKNSAIIETCMPEETPLTYESLLKYDAFILADISYERFNEDFIINLEAVIKNQGKGLLVTGGDSSYGPGGYYLTKLEEILPVNMDVKPKEEKPNLGLVLVIDKSGSMTEGQYGISKLELAKEAAIRSVEVLEAKDQLGVIAFDDSVKWVIEMTKAEDKVALQDTIATIRPGGGTTIRPSVEAAVKALKDADTKLKHIILITDGQAEATGYEAIMADCQANGITLSTVAVGQGADKRLLQALSTAGGGRYYETDEFSDIPSIFTKEAFMAGKKYLNNITFSPTLQNYSQILKGIEAVPELDGYVATSIKNEARLLLSGPEEDPVLAAWQYGLGRTVAWTSDANGIWTGKWMAWEQSPLFWMNIVSWLVQKDLNKNYTVETTYLAGEGVVTVTSTDQSNALGTLIEGIIVNPEGEEQRITLEATSPGTYTGTFDAKGEGVYLANLLMQLENSTEQIVTGLNIGYSPEYDFYSNGGISPERMIQISGGRILRSAKEVYQGKLPEVQGSNNITNVLLVLGLLLFMVEIIIRKTYMNLSFLEAIIRWVRERADAVASQVRGLMVDKKSRRKLSERQSVEAGARGQTVVNAGIGGVDGKKNGGGEGKSTGNSSGKEQSKPTQPDTDHLDTLLSNKRKRGG